MALRRAPAQRAELQMVTTTSGLIYEETEAGTGVTPSLDQSVTVHYTGKLLDDGKVFDSSFSRGQPTTFKVNQVIKGWQEGLQLMKEGGKATLTIPAELAYGPKQMNDIPPNSDLLFEVELIKVAEGGSGGMDAIIPQGYLERSFASASTKPREPKDPNAPAESAMASPLGLAAIALIGLASYFGVLPK
eukprot:CAMPEP_0115854494 /NCGR_PEP_ID=MMETSP0287-20121206/14053_1 /TAXON_ID=412157 /ORGANISM="Chrysochromulina rotalis, Strain UIO044" /LENGTH=188 /DNA_ID=CAMNT_0003308613 /DNA_START=107 /DNA_END=673 /DNA_ORIENTATION=-